MHVLLLQRFTNERQCVSLVMAGHSRPKDGVLSHAYAPAIHAFSCCNDVKTWMPGTGPGMTKSIVAARGSQPKPIPAPRRQLCDALRSPARSSKMSRA